MYTFGSVVNCLWFCDCRLLEGVWFNSQSSTFFWTWVDWTGLDWTGLEWSGLDLSGVDWTWVEWSGVEWTGLEWSGVDLTWVEWSGLGWSGLDWTGLHMESSGVQWSPVESIWTVGGTAKYCSFADIYMVIGNVGKVDPFTPKNALHYLWCQIFITFLLRSDQ